MRQRLVWLVTLLAAPAIAWSVASLPAQADTPAFVVFTAPTGSLAGPPVPLLFGQPAVGTISSTTGTGSPIVVGPALLLLAAHPQTGAYTVSLGTTMPSLPGVTLYAPQVLIPPIQAPGQSLAAILNELLQGAGLPSAYNVLPVP